MRKVGLEKIERRDIYIGKEKMEGKNAEEVKGMLGEENNEERRRWNKKVQYKEENKKRWKSMGSGRKNVLKTSTEILQPLKYLQLFKNKSLCTYTALKK